MSEIVHPQLPPNPLAVQMEEMGHKEFAKAVDRGEIPSLTGKLLDSVRYELIQNAIAHIPDDEMVETHIAIRDAKGAIQRDNEGFAKSEKRFVFKRDVLLKKLLQEQGLALSDWQAWEKRKNVRQSTGKTVA